MRYGAATESRCTHPLELTRCRGRHGRDALYRHGVFHVCKLVSDVEAGLVLPDQSDDLPTAPFGKFQQLYKVAMVGVPARLFSTVT